ncbi:MAG: zinc-ribbon domain-containing protein [Candidatus Krumholzibacteria bacterium]|jgi:predicted Zn finger-like uncharacterized protein|nr:zinc-ribbon domain-containing protein [Candidatus Krumholzibacteria bacterium]
MIVTCDGCQTRYMLGNDKVPPRGIRVRCPKCRFVWKLTAAAEKPVFEVSSGRFSSEAAAAEAPAGGWNASPQRSTVVMTEPEISAPGIGPEKEVEIRSGDRSAAPSLTEAQESPELKRKRERTRRLARVFVSDILVYNKEKRNQALGEGNLMAALGPEIKKAWEAYKEKVGTELKESNDYFREALNDILADGQEVF